MRKDLLKRLNELISRVRTVAWIKGEAPSLNAACSAWDKKWNELRDEIESERCENCKHWGYTWPGLNRTGACDEFPSRPVTKPDFYCDNFEKKEPGL